MHHHLILEGMLYGGGLTWLVSGITSTMPPYTGNNFWAKWAWALMHWVGANWDKLHIPGSAGDMAAMPKNGDTQK